MKKLSGIVGGTIVVMIGLVTVTLFQNCSSGSVPSDVSSASGATAAAVTTPLLMYPASTSVVAGGSVILTVTGGVSPYTFTVAGGGSVASDPLAGYIFSASANPGTVVVTVTDSVQATYTASLTVSPATNTTVTTTAPASVPIYRYNNTTTLEHAFSTSATDGWLGQNEGVVYNLASNASAGGVPYYRCELDHLNQPYPTRFFYNTTSANCENYGVAPTLLGYIYPTSTVANTQPLYRFRQNFQSVYGDNGAAVDHIDSLSAVPPGPNWVLESVMGYVPTN